MNQTVDFRWRFDLLAAGGSKRALLCRQGPDAPWRQIAVFDNYNEAERVLEILRIEYPA